MAAIWVDIEGSAGHYMAYACIHSHQSLSNSAKTRFVPVGYNLAGGRVTENLRAHFAH